MLIEPATEILGRVGAVDFSPRAPALQGGATAGDVGGAPEILAVGDPALAKAGLVPALDPDTDDPTPPSNLARPDPLVAGEARSTGRTDVAGRRFPAPRPASRGKFHESLCVILSLNDAGFFIAIGEMNDRSPAAHVRPKISGGPQLGVGGCPPSSRRHLGCSAGHEPEAEP